MYTSVLKHLLIVNNSNSLILHRLSVPHALWLVILHSSFHLPSTFFPRGALSCTISLYLRCSPWLVILHSSFHLPSLVLFFPSWCLIVYLFFVDSRAYQKALLGLLFCTSSRRPHLVGNNTGRRHLRHSTECPLCTALSRWQDVQVRKGKKRLFNAVFLTSKAWSGLHPMRDYNFIIYPIGDFRVVFRLCFKASPSAKPFLWKLVLFTCKWTTICMWIKLISIWKASH